MAIEYKDYLKALDTVREYRAQQKNSPANANSRFFEWQGRFQKWTNDSLVRLFNDGFFNVRSGLIRDLSVKNLAEHTVKDYYTQEGIGSGFIRDIKSICKEAGFVIED